MCEVERWNEVIMNCVYVSLYHDDERLQYIMAPNLKNTAYLKFVYSPGLDSNPPLSFLLLIWSFDKNNNFLHRILRKMNRFLIPFFWMNEKIHRSTRYIV